nr:chemotaxis protein CheB [Sphingomonas liriopis]
MQPAVEAEANDPASSRILIVDDSVVARAVIERIVAGTKRYVVAASVSTVDAALAFLARESVAFILLDVQLPGVDGITALPDLIAAGQGAAILIVSGSATAGASVTVQALTLGAADTLLKPAAGERMTLFSDALVDKLDRLANPARIAGIASASAAAPVPMAVTDEYDVVAIGASTGGIHALSQLLRAIPPEFRLPILITQHLPASFMPYFAAQLAVLAGRPCEVATDRLRLRPGRILVAPGDAHIRCVALADGSAAIRLNSEPSQSGCMPSVDPMFASMAGVFGSRMLAIVLSGMGRDGVDGARQVHQAGGCVVVQDQASSVIWGMPGAVADAGVADAILPPDTIGMLAAARRRP